MRLRVRNWHKSLRLCPLIQAILIIHVRCVSGLSIGLEAEWLLVEREVEGLVSVHGWVVSEVDIVNIEVELSKVLSFKLRE